VFDPGLNRQNLHDDNLFLLCLKFALHDILRDLDGILNALKSRLFLSGCLCPNLLNDASVIDAPQLGGTLQLQCLFSFAPGIGKRLLPRPLNYLLR
jgi:hypothetical protein